MIDWGAYASAQPMVLKGLGYTLRLTAAAAFGGLLWGSVLALGRLSHVHIVARAAAVYVHVMRSVPLLLVLFWFYFLAPVVLQWLSASPYPPRLGAERSAYITFVLFEGAYFCEIVRAGVLSLGRGQLAAAYALGLGRVRAMALVILPQALRNMLPVLLTQTIILFQDVSLVALLGVTDLVGAATKIGHRDGTLVEMYAAVAAIYFTLSYALTVGARRLAARPAAGH